MNQKKLKKKKKRKWRGKGEEIYANNS